MPRSSGTLSRRACRPRLPPSTAARTIAQFADAAADAALQFAMTTSAVKGTGKANDRAVKVMPLDSLAYGGGHLQK
jgi:hypothetical protein